MADTNIEWTDVTARRFWTYVDKSGECWNWTGGTFSGRYGQFRAGTRKVKAHRFAWVIAGHDLPPDMILCHRCDNVRCVRPEHLFLGTHADNAHDRDAKGRAARDHAPRLPGEMNPAARLSRVQALTIRSRIAQGERRKVLAREFGVSVSTVNAIAQRRIWQT